MRILIVGDTHVPTRGHRVPRQILEEARTADLVIHSGDFDSMTVYQTFVDAASDLRAVSGNQDAFELQHQLPDVLEFTLEGVNFVVTHGHRWGRPRPSRMASEFSNRADVIIYGHLHQSFVIPFEGITVVNAGSPIDPRGGEASFIVASVDAGTFHAAIKHLDHVAAD